MDELAAAMAGLSIKSYQLSSDGMDNLTADLTRLTMRSQQVTDECVNEITAAFRGLSTNAQQLPVSACTENPQIQRQVTLSTLPETLKPTNAQVNNIDSDNFYVYALQILNYFLLVL